MAMMMKEAFPNRSPGDHFWKHPIRALKFLTWMPSGSIRFALDPAVDNKTFNRFWKERSHGVFLGYILPIIALISRGMQIEKLVDWYADRQCRKALGKIQSDQNLQFRPARKTDRRDLQKAA
jgi:hypothetical protein